MASGGIAFKPRGARSRAKLSVGAMPLLEHGYAEVKRELKPVDSDVVRIDICFDVGGLALPAGLKPFFRGYRNGNIMERGKHPSITYMVGAGERVLRVYRKDLEARRKGVLKSIAPLWAQKGWSGEPVTRFEYQLRHRLAAAAEDDVMGAAVKSLKALWIATEPGGAVRVGLWSLLEKASGCEAPVGGGRLDLMVEVRRIHKAIGALEGRLNALGMDLGTVGESPDRAQARAAAGRRWTGVYGGISGLDYMRLLTHLEESYGGRRERLLGAILAHRKDLDIVEARRRAVLHSSGDGENTYDTELPGQNASSEDCKGADWT